ncbi:MAG: hypothetical protein KBD01_07685 [Acidobacteria bacterium]|nr:hypothetical protein [Acidobacteriota bacterium]
MTEETKIQLRRSTRVLLERDGYAGPAPGRMALVLARAGVGKTAFLVGIGLDALLAGQKVLHVTLHRTVEKVRAWYDELVDELVRSQGIPEARTEILLEIERHRHIRTFFGSSFGPDQLRQTLELLASHAEFRPDLIIVDRLMLEETPRETIEKVCEVARESGAELWMSGRTHRDAPPARAGHLPQPADGLEDLVDLAFLLKHDGQVVRLHVLKDHDHVMSRRMDVALDPNTLLLVGEGG